MEENEGYYPEKPCWNCAFLYPGKNEFYKCSNKNLKFSSTWNIGIGKLERKNPEQSYCAGIGFKEKFTQTKLF